MNVYKRLKSLLNKKQKSKIVTLTFLSFIGALLETLGVSSIIPLVSAVVSPDTILQNEKVVVILDKIGLSDIDKTTFIIWMLIAVMVIFVIKNLYMLALYYVQAGFVRNTESYTSIRLLGDYLNRPYSFYISADTDINAIFQTINQNIPHVFELLQEVMKLITEIAVSLCLCVLLLIVDFKMTISMALVLLAMVAIIVFILKPKLGVMGQTRVKQQTNTIRWMQQSVFGIKDVKVAAKEKYFLSQFDESYKKLANVSRRYTVFNNAPKLFIETVCIVGLLGYMLVSVVNGVDMVNMVPQLSAFALAAVRLMPSVNRISTHLSSIAYYEPSLNYVTDNLNVANLGDNDYSMHEKRLELKDAIKVENVTFAYPGTDKKIFEDANMLIPAGKSIGVVGSSGAGKTTVIDILLGLLEPDKGVITCDGIDIKDDYAAWLHNVGYIAQNIYMLDTSIRENVAFGIAPEKVNEERVWEVLREAQMEEYVKSLPEGLDTIIGDRGIRISGGQRQRLGIARALYKDPAILVFDEATSALDNETEAAIMDAINSLKGSKTMVIIAHRLKTIENCDIVYRVENGKINETKLEIKG